MLNFEVEAIHPQTGASKRFRVRCSTVKEAKRAVRRKGHRPGMVRLVDPTEAEEAAYQAATPELSELDLLAEAVAELAGEQSSSASAASESRQQEPGASPNSGRAHGPSKSSSNHSVNPSGTPQAKAQAALAVEPIPRPRSDRPLAALPGAARGPSAHRVAWWTVVVCLGFGGMLAVAGIGVFLAAVTGAGTGMLALGVGMMIGSVVVLIGAQVLRVVIDLSERDPG